VTRCRCSGRELDWMLEVKPRKADPNRKPARTIREQLEHIWDDTGEGYRYQFGRLRMPHLDELPSNDLCPRCMKQCAGGCL
jgi:hypothetical protein